MTANKKVEEFFFLIDATSIWEMFVNWDLQWPGRKKKKETTDPHPGERRDFLIRKVRFLVDFFSTSNKNGKLQPPASLWDFPVSV